ncbi:CCR4-NOT core subunit cdc39, partial [Cryomyces antarcticus]
LKLNLKFEIEVLCKDLDLDLKTIEPSDAIQGPRPIAEEELLGQVLPNGMEGFADLSLMGLNRVRGPNERFSPATITAALPDLGSLLHYPPASNGSHHQLKQIFLTAAQQAIHEIIAPVVERSVTIAAISTAQLVDKDFATEPNVDRYRESAHTVVKSLSGSLALVTCKEPLRMSITNNIRIMAGNLAQQEGRNVLPEGNIIMFVNDNLDT